MLLTFAFDLCYVSIGGVWISIEGLGKFEIVYCLLISFINNNEIGNNKVWFLN